MLCLDHHYAVAKSLVRNRQDFIFENLMKTYEMSFVISPEMSSAEAEAKAKEIESAILSREGVILKQLTPVARTLAFPINNRASGFFGVFEFQLEPEKLLEVKDMVGKDKKFIRHMVIVKEAIRIKRNRRSRNSESEVAVVTEQKIETTPTPVTITEPTVSEEKPAEEKPAEVKPAEKVELKDIEEQLDEILG